MTTRKKPNKVLSCSVTSITDLDAWPYEDFPGDPYWSGGPSPKSYLFDATIDIYQQNHGDPSTREPYKYNGNDVYVGDWIADTTKGRSLRIIKIIEKDSNVVRVVLEDVERYNLFLYKYGAFSTPMKCVIFEINDDNSPILNPLPADFADFTFSQEVMGRFQNNNPLYRTRVIQENHGLSDNEVIWVDPSDGLFKKITNDDEMKRMVGTVDMAGPGADIFYFIPTTKVVDGIDPPLPGSAGEFIYADPITGKLSNVQSDTNKIAYIQLTNSKPDITYSTNTIVTTGSILSINDVNVTFTGTTLSDVVDDVNSSTNQHNVVATLMPPVNKVSSEPSRLQYGMVAAIGNVMSATINGVLVTFNDTTNGSIEFGTTAANAVDMANSINAANIPNIHASGVGSTLLTIENNNGGEINIVNITPDSSGVDFSSPTAVDKSASGIISYTAAGGVPYIKFDNPKGNGIIFKNINGTPVSDLGLTSARNGELPKGLVVEQSVVTTAPPTKIYATLADLPVSGSPGEQAYVIDSDDGAGNNVGEWAMFLWDGTSWVRTTNEDSASTDAKTLSTDIFYNTASPVIIGTLSDKRKVVSVVVEVITPFDGTPILDIGDEFNSDSLMTDDNVDLHSLATYGSTPNFLYEYGQDVDIIATFDFSTSTQGHIKVNITYV